MGIYAGVSSRRCAGYAGRNFGFNMNNGTYGQVGLTDDEVRARIEEGLVNKSEVSAGKSVKDIILSNTLTYFNFIFLVIAVMLCIVGSFKNLTFLPIVIGNTLIGIIQELRAKKTLDKMSLLNAPHAVALRNGVRVRLSSEELVLGDTVIFSAGDQICADARVLAGSVRVNESLLTGESDEIPKGENDTLMSGSFVVSGECVAVLEAVGADAYISKLTSEAKSNRGGEQSEMMRSVNRIVKIIGIILIPIAGVLFYMSFFANKLTFKESVVSTVAAIIGMIPEGLYLLTTAALTLGTIRLGSKKVLLNDMKSIEALARADILCVDKTGTITEADMQLYRLVPLEADSDFKDRLCDYISASTDNNATAEALRRHFGGQSGNAKAIDVLPFSSAKKFGAVRFEDGTYVLGAPEFVLGAIDAGLNEKIAHYSGRGYRVLVLAWQSEPIGDSGTGDDITPLGLAVLTNAIRENAAETFGYFKAQGVNIKVISGDNPDTVAEVARRAGIDGAEKYIDASKLDDESLKAAALEFTVFGRVKPDQKRTLVNALQSAGHTVAMTGDGVNDILAMKEADCSIAMASGSEAASQAAQVVLLDSDFARMPSVVAEGRRVVNNIERSASLFLVKNIFSLLLAIMTSILMLTYPLEPSHISLISLFTIGVPGFLLALEKNENRIKGHFMKNVMIRALPAGLTDAIIVGSFAISGQVFGLGKDDIATASTIVLSVVGFMILRRLCTPFNKYRTFVFLVNIFGMIITFAFLPELFSIARLPITVALLAIIFSFASESMFRILTRTVEESGGFFKKAVGAFKGKKRAGTDSSDSNTRKAKS